MGRRPACVFWWFLAVVPLFAQYAQMPGTQPPLKRYGLEEGLNQSTVMCLLRDSRGLIWFGTEMGLYRFDGYDFKSYVHHKDDPASLPDNWVQEMTEDGSGNIWVATLQGLARLEVRTDRVQRIYASTNVPEHLTFDADGRLWLGTKNEVIRMDLRDFSVKTLDPPDASRVRFLHDRRGRFWLCKDGSLWRVEAGNPVQVEGVVLPGKIWDLLEDRHIDGLFWGISGSGIWRYHSGTGAFEFFSPPEMKGTLGLARGVHDPFGKPGIWLASQLHGLWYFDTEQHTFTPYGNSLGIGGQRLLSIIADPVEKGILWLGSKGGGLLRLDLRPGFKHVTHIKGEPNSLADPILFGLLESSDGCLWFATHGKGLSRWYPEQNRFRTYLADPNDPNGLPDNNVYSLMEDSQGYVWVSTLGGLWRLNPQTDAAVSYGALETGFPSNACFGMLEDGGGLWVSFIERLGFMSHLEGGPFRFFPEIRRGYKILADAGGRLWVAANSGLGLISKDRLSCRNFDPSNSRLPHKTVSWLVQDPNQPSLIWASSAKGLFHVDTEHDQFRPVNPAWELPDSMVYTMLFDDRGQLWFTSNEGLWSLDPASGKTRRFTKDHGLQGGEYNSMSVTKTRDGLFLFGGMNGFNWFDPSWIQPDTTEPRVTFTELALANQTMRPRHEQPDSPLDGVIDMTTDLTLGYEARMFSLKFSAQVFGNPNQVRYGYRLAGFDQDWIYRDAGERVATYTNIGHGEYVLRVKAANADGLWGPPSEMALTITPPLWQTWWAYSLYILLLLTLVWVYVRAQNRRLAYERSVNARLQQLDRLKDEFLANTSHELRTPLNGIIGLAEGLMDGAAGKPSGEMHENLGMIAISGRRLAHLVNDLLDFSKLKERDINISPKNIALQSLVEVVLTLSRSLARDKQLQLINGVGPEIVVYADENRLQQILYNLVGNAVKFTESGSVTVTARNRDTRVVVSVKDTGPGIPGAQQERIFVAFEQADGSEARGHGGTGLGLTITRRLVEIHGGTIGLTSEPGAGSTFFFDLAQGDGGAPHQLESRLEPAPEDLLETPALTPAEVLKTRPDGVPFHILVVDDEPINRRVLSNHLLPLGYGVTEAEDGRKALAMLEKHHDFDLVLLDIMMPHISGYEVCRKLRSQVHMHVLPVIFLTAKNRAEDLVAGFDAGGNDYLVKPFARAELLSRIDTHLRLLDTNRNLEAKVSDRTRALKEKNKEILRTRDRLIMQEKMVFLGKLASGMAHEIKNPLNFVNNLAGLSAEMARELAVELAGQKEQLTQDVYGDLQEITDVMENNAEKIVQHGGRVDRIVEALMAFARERKDGAREIAINGFVEQAVALARATGADDVGEWVWSLDERVGMLEILPSDLTQALVSLVNNGMEAVAARRVKEPSYRGTITVGTRLQDQLIELFVCDDGIGLGEAKPDELFNPFYTTKGAMGHIGLGLAIAQDIVTQGHDGKLSLSENHRHTTATIRLRLPSLRPEDADPVLP